MILTPDNEYTVVLDACVLAPMPICDLLLHLATEPATFRPVWSVQILDEVRKTLVERFGYPVSKANRRIDAMSQFFPEASVKVPDVLISAVPNMPDPSDRHVVAAGIRGKAHQILTKNLRHFPQTVLSDFGLEAVSPDEFLVNQFHLNPGLVLEKLDAQATDIRRERLHIIRLLRDLHQAVRFADLVEQRTQS